MSDAGACHRQVLSQGPLGNVAICSCGHVHVTVQAVTLRLDQESFAHLARLVAGAQHALAPPVEEHPQEEVPARVQPRTWGRTPTEEM